MNNAQMYLAWLRTTSPDIYMQALRKVLGQPRTLGGLNSDLVDSMTAPATFGSFGQDSSSSDTLPEVTVSATPLPPDTSGDTYTPFDPTAGGFEWSGPSAGDVTLPSPIQPIAPGDLAPVAPVVNIDPATPPAGSNSWIDAVAKAVASVANTALTTSNQSNLVKLNTQRAQQGLPPVNANGQVVTSGYAPASSAIYRLEAAISGATGVGGMPIMLLAGVGLLAYLFLKRK